MVTGAWKGWRATWFSSLPWTRTIRPCKLNKKPDGGWVSTTYLPVSESRTPTPVLGSQMPSKPPKRARCRNVPGQHPRHTGARLYLQTNTINIAQSDTGGCCFCFDWRAKGKGLMSYRHFRGVGVRLTALFFSMGILTPMAKQG
jgi:hypothetical protein